MQQILFRRVSLCLGIGAVALSLGAVVAGPTLNGSSTRLADDPTMNIALTHVERPVVSLDPVPEEDWALPKEDQQRPRAQ
jgi:hypothetical protein